MHGRTQIKARAKCCGKRESMHNYIHFTLHLNNSGVEKESASPLLTHQADEGYVNRLSWLCHILYHSAKAFIIILSTCQSLIHWSLYATQLIRESSACSAKSPQLLYFTLLVYSTTKCRFATFLLVNYQKRAYFLKAKK